MVKTMARPMFNRAHYNKIAAVLGRHIRDNSRLTLDQGRQQQIYMNSASFGITAQFVLMFKEDNPEFDEDKFLEAVVRHAQQPRPAE